MKSFAHVTAHSTLEETGNGMLRIRDNHDSRTREEVHLRFNRRLSSPDKWRYEKASIITMRHTTKRCALEGRLKSHTSRKWQLKRASPEGSSDKWDQWARLLEQ